MRKILFLLAFGLTVSNAAFAQKNGGGGDVGSATGGIIQCEAAVTHVVLDEDGKKVWSNSNEFASSYIAGKGIATLARRIENTDLKNLVFKKGEFETRTPDNKLVVKDHPLLDASKTSDSTIAVHNTSFAPEQLAQGDYVLLTTSSSKGTVIVSAVSFDKHQPTMNTRVILIRNGKTYERYNAATQVADLAKASAENPDVPAIKLWQALPLDTAATMSLSCYFVK